MPQLDLVSYLSTVIWFIIFFVSLLYLFAMRYLPKLASVLKLRAKQKTRYQQKSSENITNLTNNETTLTPKVLQIFNTIDKITK